jgi:tetratricopeptide (TPR) repeat protein
MSLSLKWKQNIIFSILLFLACLAAIPFYHLLNREWVLYKQAELKYLNKDYSQAAILYQKSLEAGAPMSRIRLKLANSYVAHGEFEKAIPLYREYLEIYPDDNKVRLELAKVLSWTNRFKEAENEYQKILDKKIKSHN